MKNMTLKNIAAACGGQFYPVSHIPIKEQEDTEIKGAVLDSRLVEEGYLFFATKGERVDGHSFIRAVSEKNAACVVCEKIPENIQIPYILVEDSFEALKKVAAFYRKNLTIPVIGITGSVGKTSTKEMIASVLSKKYDVLKTEGNYNNEIGVPLTILKIREHHQAAVIEMGINHFGEMHRLSEIARPDVCVMTNIGQCHLEFLGSREGILKAKSEIFDFMNPKGYVCINGDDDMLSTIGRVHENHPISYGLSSKNNVYATQIESNGIFGTKATIHLKGETFDVAIPLPGEHMVMNALAAVCVGDLLGVSREEMIKGIESVKTVGGRSNLIKTEDKTILDDCYNANPVSMKAAIDLLKLADTRKVAILGDMFELGEDEIKLHKEVGSYAAEAGIDVLVFAGSLSRFMYEEALKKSEKMEKKIEILHKKDRFDIIKDLENIVKSGDTILVKASHGMGFSEIVTALQK